MALLTHLNNPKVTRLIGKRSIFIIGFAKKKVALKAAAERRSVCIPFSKINPSVIWVSAYNETASIRKLLNILFI